ncbi:MAG: alpha-glucan family phosphorylase [Acidobacteria bacterium]|nr:alpha-glucan family phosphorylase [Acidobacteriota bacterium]
MTEASKDISTQAQPSPVFRQDFELNRELPPQLNELEALSRNFWWSWHPEATSLFRDIDPVLWDECEQNPRALLRRIGEFELRRRATDSLYLQRLAGVSRAFEEYLELDTGSRIAYFCAEYGVHHSLPNYSGGLGILAGDHLKSASDLNTPLAAIGLFYRYGYFRQRIGHDGWQNETYNDLFESDLALTPVVDGEGSPITVCVHIRGREVTARAWLANVGRIRLYLLDSNMPENSDDDRLITGHLYGGDTETRIVQEKLLGIGGVRLLRKLGISPEVYHLNEGHAAFSTLELAREYLEENTDAGFADAVESVREMCVFTTHTPVAAGNDMFEPKLLRECFSDEFIAALKLTDNEFLALGRSDLTDDAEFFGMTPLAIRMCRSSNGVSEKHGEVSRGLWKKMFPKLDSENDVPITHVTNGVHSPTWIAPLLQDVLRNGCDDGELWDAHCRLKRLLITFLRERTRSSATGSTQTINEHRDTSSLLDPDALTIGFARRVAAYKRWSLIFSDIDRLLRLVDDEQRPVQFVFAGKAHPQDNTAKTILQELMSINHDSGWQRRAVFVEDYDQEVARYLVHGVDVWLNLPLRPMEASGTSGMKAAMNGVLNMSILDGWWIEGYNGENGFAIGDLEKELTDEEMDKNDSASFYDVLENSVIPAFYDRGSDGLPKAWIRMMRNSIDTLTPQFSSDRMVNDYITEIYKL